MNTNEEIIGLEEYCKILFAIESFEELSRNSITIAKEISDKVKLTKISSQPKLMLVLFCETFLETPMGYPVKEFFEMGKEAEVNSYSKMILTGVFKRTKNKKGEDEIYKNTNIKYHKLLQLISKDTEEAIIMHGKLYANIIGNTYALWKKEGTNKVNISNSYSCNELDGYNINEIIEKKYRDIRKVYCLEHILPEEWPNPYELIVACLFVIITNYPFPDYLEKRNDVKRSNEVKIFKDRIVQNIQIFFEKPYVERDEKKTPDILVGEWSKKIKEAIIWCDNCIEIIPELTTVKQIRSNLHIKQKELNLRYTRAIIDQSKNEMEKVLNVIRDEISKIPCMMERLELLRKTAEQVNPEMLPIYDESMNETYEKTFAIGSLKNNSRRDD